MSTTATASPVQPYTERPLPSRWTIANPTRGALVASVLVALVALGSPVGTATDARVKLTSADGATKWLSIAPGTVWAIARAVLESEPVR